MAIVITVVVVQLAFAFLSAWLAREKGRGYDSWWMLGFLFGVFALLTVGFAPPRAAKPIRSTSKRDEMPSQIGLVEDKIAPDALPWNPRLGPPPKSTGE